jgi:hypothetical protein
MSFFDGLGNFLGGLFTDSSKPYDKAREQYMQYMGQGMAQQQPYQQAGIQAIGDYQNWLQSQQDPTKYINALMGGYQESPYAQNLQRQSMLAGQNMASASGLMGSSPLLQQMQQNAGNITSADQNQWLQNLLGISRQYGQGEQSLMQGGQSSANALAQMYAQMAGQMGDNAYSRERAKQKQLSETIGGGLDMLSGLSFFGGI